jgi:hypothetical protein
MNNETQHTAEFYYEWGNEPTGYVSTGCYVNDEFKSTGLMRLSEVKALGLKFNCPHA